MRRDVKHVIPMWILLLSSAAAVALAVADAASVLTTLVALLQEDSIRWLVSPAVCFAYTLAYAITHVWPLCCFGLFAFHIFRTHDLFGLTQTAFLTGAGVGFLLQTLLLCAEGMCMPALSGLRSMGMSYASWSLGGSLCLAFMFFALAGIFEYGRILQEDSDNIL